MSRWRFHGLKRIKFRMTWNKYNLYNLTRMKAPFVSGKTFFQQKWGAKSITRAYHGEQIREGQWERMFSTRLNAVVPMDHTYLAEHDGSEQAAGRGSGLEQPFTSNRKPKKHIPYMQMTYAPIERRLDVAIFRSLFASSARQARQFVTHGKVKVNGKKMPYPGYLLNPGDMFQVDPDRVLFATGEPKSPEQIKQGREIRRQRRATNIKRAEKKAAAREKAVKAAAEKIASEETRETVTSKPRQEPVTQTEEKEVRKERKTDLQTLLKRVKVVMENKKIPPTAKRKQELRKFTKDVKTSMSQINRKPVPDLETDLAELVGRLSLITSKKAPSSTAKPESSSTEESAKPKPKEATEAERLQVRNTMIQHRQTYTDESKPYATPWRPRPYMSAFAFIPRYLEVNHAICSAVYLRHPVARPGLTEVPTPFNPETLQLAFNWYLRRR